MYSLVCVYSFCNHCGFLVNIKSVPLCVVVLFNVTGKQHFIFSEMQFDTIELGKDRNAQLGTVQVVIMQNKYCKRVQMHHIAPSKL